MWNRDITHRHGWVALRTLMGPGLRSVVNPWFASGPAVLHPGLPPTLLKPPHFLFTAHALARCSGVPRVGVAAGR